MANELFLLRNPACLIRSDVIQKNNLFFDEQIRYAENDIFTFLTLASAQKISLIRESFLYYRQNNPDSLTSNKKEYFKDSLIGIVNLYYRMIKLKLDNFLNAYKILSRQIMAWILDACPNEEKRKNLLLIKKIFPQEVFERIFFCPAPQAKISVIIPVYNAAEFLPECLDSVLNQTLKEIEIICVDDGSTDNSFDILNQYAAKDNRILVLKQNNQRQAVARNKAMEFATGDYIQFLDADDYMEPDACECLYLYSNLFCLDMCQCAAVEFYHHNKKEFKSNYHCLEWLPQNYPSVFNKETATDFLPYMAVTAWLTFYHRSFLIKNNIHWIDKKIAYEDTPFFTESILKATRVGALKAPLYHRRVHNLATTQQISSNFNEYMEILKYTLTIIKRLTDPNLLLQYCYVFSQKAWLNFARLEITDKVKMADSFYDFCIFIQKKYRYTLSPEIRQWCQNYLKGKNKIEKFKFKVSTFKANHIKNRWSLNLIIIQRKPYPAISILGIPVLYTKVLLRTIIQNPSKKEIEKNIKFCGLTLMKIKESLND